MTQQPKLKNTMSRSPNIFAKIQAILVSHGAREFTFEMDAQGKYSAVRFALAAPGGRILHFRMPARVREVQQVLIKQAHTVAQENTARKQAYQTAWACVRDWLDAQFMLIDIGNTETAQIFLPYLIVGEDNQTLYEAMKEQQFLLPSPRTTISEE
jgi:hypothetical protein